MISYLKVHEAGHLGMLKYKMCDDSFSSLHELKKHKYFAHQGGEMLSWTKCDFKAWYHTCLKNYEQSHNKKTNKCDKCDYMGKTVENLKKSPKKTQRSNILV